MFRSHSLATGAIGSKDGFRSSSSPTGRARPLKGFHRVRCFTKDRCPQGAYAKGEWED